MVPMVLDVVFDLSLEHGRCVGVRIPEEEGHLHALAEERLLAEEREPIARFAPARRRSWVGGRAAMREALERASFSAPAVLSDARGAPTLPRDLAGSISHKDHIAVALVAREAVARVGVDVERDAAQRTDISSRVLATDELAELDGLDPRSRDRQVLLRFSAKEAVYKALDPFVGRYVGFKEISVAVRPGGDAVVGSRLPATEGPFAIDVRWRLLDGLILTTARVTLRP